LQSLDAARRAGSPRIEVVELDRLGTIDNKLGQPVEALTHLNLALRLVRTMNDPAGESLVLSEMARSQFLLGNLEAARPLAADSVRLTDSVRSSYLDPILRALYLSRSREAYSQLTRILMRLHAQHPGQGFDREAFNTSERARSRSLLEILSGEQPDAVAPLDINRIQKEVLDADTILLQYVLSDESSFLFVVSRGRLSGYELPARRVIEDLARRVHQSWSAGSGSDNGSAAELTRIILQPAIGEIRGKRLLISAEGALQYIPFAALPLPEGGRVVDSHEVVNLASASTVAVMRERTAARKPAAKWVAVIADPVFDPNDPRVTGKPGPAVLPRDLQRSVSDAGLTHLERLLSTRREAQYIASLAPAGSLMEALDFDASRATATSARLSGYRIVHLAAHGLVDSRHPELSGIVLSMVDRQGRPQDGFLRAGEVHKLKLGADLIVLSACQTALGREIDGEGLIGLTRGFMRAGAPRVVASLWRVSDRATSELMKRFYQGMLSGKLSPAAALRQAQLDLSRQRQWATPYYWAGFTLQGEWR
jgi:CHAT domain-containing protein